MLTSIVKAFGFALYALGRKAHPVGGWWLVVEQSITQSMGFTVQSAVTDWTILRVLAEKRPTQNLASSLLYRQPEIESFFTPQRKWRGQPADHPTYAPGGGPSLPRALYRGSWVAR